MPVDAGAIPVLTRWGLSADADLVYRALTLLGPAAGIRLARELDLARSRTRAALDELAAAGITTIAGSTWVARPPAEVVRLFQAPAGERWRQHFAAIEGIGARWWPGRTARQRHGQAGDVLVTHGKFEAALRALVGRDPAHPEVPIDLSPRESALVGLLALGHTDRSAADELGLSTRTVAYTMRALMDRLGVRNRFQLAVTLGAAGAVRPA